MTAPLALLLALPAIAPATQEGGGDPEGTVDHPRRANRLAGETSPYLLQHAHNPVDWFPWGEEAFERARRGDKPIFLSIGYSACHWCHVMERESFEDEAIAALMNENFVCVKVDREERPDVDEIYMKAVQILTRSGGWPMSVFLTPDGKPFFGGTYFPPEDRYGRAGFPRVLQEMARLWRDERARVTGAAEGLTGEIRRIVAPPPAAGEGVPQGVLARAVEQILAGFDDVHGGFGGAPKFPHPMDLALLLRADARFGHAPARHAALFTLGKMARGGMYDQLGGGFHRYSVDERWLVPHFEKMLYDNAQLANAYLDAWLAGGGDEHGRVVDEILDYVLREMTAPEGGFHSTQDADSEGEEGKFFVWDPKELAQVLGEDEAAWIAPFFGVSDAGNFEHRKSILWRPWEVEDFAKARSMEPERVRAGVEAARAKLFAARSARVAPGRDDKILADWNGLMISAFARAGFHRAQPRFVEAAARAAAFARERLWNEAEGRLLRSFKDGRARHAANLADFAFLAEGLLDLWQARFDPADLAFAKRLVDVSIERFWDGKDGGFYFTADDAEPLIARSKEAYDGATPSGTSVQVMNLLRLAELLGDDSYRQRAVRTIELHRAVLEQRAPAVSRMVAACDFLESQPREIVLTGASLETVEPFLAVLRAGYDPDRVVLVVTPQTRAALEPLSPLVAGKSVIDGRPAAYVCRGGTCRLPVTDPSWLEQELRAQQ